MKQLDIMQPSGWRAAATVASSGRCGLWWLAVATTVVTVVAEVMQRHHGTELPPDTVVATTVVQTPCECKQRCYADAGCRGCSSSPRGPTQHWCNTTATSMSGVALVATQRSRTVTYLKRPYCDEPYFEAEGLGCIYISKEFLTYEKAVKGCPEGFPLFSPTSTAQYWRMADYLLHNYSQPRDDDKCGPNNPLSDGTPAACDRDPNRGVQCCLADGVCANPSQCGCDGCVNYKDLTKAFWTGIYLSASKWKLADGTVIQSGKGTGLWSPNDPKDADDCAAMWYAPVSNALYHLASASCTRPTTFICQKGL